MNPGFKSYLDKKSDKKIKKMSSNSGTHFFKDKFLKFTFIKKLRFIYIKYILVIIIYYKKK